MRQQTKGLFFYLYLAVIASLLYAPEVAGVSQNNICDSSGGQEIQLSKDLSLYTLIDEKNATFYAKLIYHGLAWLSLGTSPSGYMVGSEVVIGLPDVSSVSKYTLNSKATSGIVRMKDSQQTLIIGSIEQNKTHTVMEYSKKLKEPNELSIVPDAYNSLIWAVGSSSVLGHHAHRNSTTVELRTKYSCENGGSLPASNNANKTNSDRLAEQHRRRQLWILHGSCASVAWGILVPLGIASSLMRRLLESMGLPKTLWFHLHRGINSLAVLLTLVAVAIAIYQVSTIDGVLWDLSMRHHQVGFFIAFLTLVQAINGFCRPQLPHTSENTISDDDIENIMKDEPSESAHKKSCTRIFWEYGHRIIGIVLLVSAWWQIQNGLGLLKSRYPQEPDLRPYFWGIVAGKCTFGILLLCLQRARARSKAKAVFNP